MPRILIVDDEQAMRGLLRQRLQDSYEIVDTGDPEEALALALQHKPDAILLDLMMPKFSGIELCQTLTSLSFTTLIPILVITGESAAKYRDFCQNLGAAGFFEKPVDFNELTARLESLLQTKRPERRSEVRVRLRVPLKLRGTDLSGAKFEVMTVTESVSAKAFLCGFTASLEKDSVVEVFLASGDERHAGRARVVRAESPGTRWQRYGFRFLERPEHWVLALA